MLTYFKVEGFKSFESIEVELPRLAVLFGPNAVGKSNFLDALQVMSRLATERTIADALSGPVRGYPHEQFTLPPGGIKDLLNQDEAHFILEAKILTDAGKKKKPVQNHYTVDVKLLPQQGNKLVLQNEYLDRANLKSMKPRIEREGDYLLIRKKGEAGHPIHESLLELNHTCLSDKRFSGSNYPDFDRTRTEFASWKIYYLDPRDVMRKAVPPEEVQDIGSSGDKLAPFLFRLSKQHPKLFRSLVQNLRTMIPSIEDITIDLDQKRGTLDIQIVQDDVSYPSRVISEGTLRVLALCALAVNPWGGSLIAFEEPENGVHPRRLESIIRLLHFIAIEKKRQVIVTPHSPQLISQIMKLDKGTKTDDIGLFVSRLEDNRSVIKRFSTPGPLFEDPEIKKALQSDQEEALLEAMLMRGWIDA